MFDIEALLRSVVEKDASDLHMKVGRPPILRIHGELLPQGGWPELDTETMQEFLEYITTDHQREILKQQLALDFSFELPGLTRFRVNAAFERGRLTCVLRQLQFHIPSIQQLGLPPICERLARKPRGLVLVTGPTGSGKSTTLAAMIQRINEDSRRRIITVEDPIEYFLQDDRCVITQRELGSDTLSFSDALRSALRQDPDVILVGEMRDLETIAAALTAAETGHLVLSTLHTPSAPQAVDRMIDVFPAHQQQQVRIQLAVTLEAVLYQTLLPKVGGGRMPAIEVLTATGAVRNLIREGKTHQMLSVMEGGREFGMQTLEQALSDLYREGHIEMDDALSASSRPDDLKRWLELLEREKYGEELVSTDRGWERDQERGGSRYGAEPAPPWEGR